MADKVTTDDCVFFINIEMKEKGMEIVKANWKRISKKGNAKDGFVRIFEAKELPTIQAVVTSTLEKIISVEFVEKTATISSYKVRKVIDNDEFKIEELAENNSVQYYEPVSDFFKAYHIEDNGASLKMLILNAKAKILVCGPEQEPEAIITSKKSAKVKCYNFGIGFTSDSWLWFDYGPSKALVVGDEPVEVTDGKYEEMEWTPAKAKKLKEQYGVNMILMHM